MRQADVALPIRAGFWKEPTTSSYDETERNNIEAHLRKLHAGTGVESPETRLTKPIEAYNPVARERSIIEAIFSWTDKEESSTIIGVTFVVSMVGAIVLEATGVVNFPLSGLIAVLMFVGGPVFSALKNLDS
jgi:hypothetical protein